MKKTAGRRRVYRIRGRGYHTSDGVTGLVFHKGDIVATDVRSIQSPAVRKTDYLGMVSFEGMYLGSYEIVETAAAEGFVRDTEPRAFTLAYVDGYTNPVPAVEGSLHGPIRGRS